MHGPFEDVAALDRVVHEPVRLAILTALESCRSADFAFLQHLIGLTNGNASAHLTRLEEAGLVDVTSLKRHWRQLDELRHTADSLAPNPD